MLHAFQLPEIVIYQKQRFVRITVPNTEEQYNLIKWIGYNPDDNDIQVIVEPLENKFLMKFIDVRENKIFYILNLHTMEPFKNSPFQIAVPNKIRKSISDRCNSQNDSIVYY